MIYYKEYQPSAAEIESFEREQRAAKLITVGQNGFPCVGTYPFMRSGEIIEIHLVRTDEQVGHLEAGPRATVLIDDVLSFVPSHWFGDIATHADQLHRTVQYECKVVIATDEDQLRGHLVRLLARYQPEGRYTPLDDPHYTPQVRALCLLQLRPILVRAKFKLGQKLSSSGRATLMEHLHQRGKVEDIKSVAAISSVSGPPTSDK